MADRTTKVTLVAQVNGYIAGMEKAAAATKATGTEAAKLSAQREAFGSLGRALMAVGAVAAVGVGLAVKSFAEFDAKMSQVKTLSHATGSEMKLLSDAALNMGQAIGFSATQVADAEIELVKAGISVKDIMGGALKGALDLAAAGQINVADATAIASSAMVQFGLSGKDVPHIADLLAAGADKALGGVTELGQALKYAGPVAASFGVSLDETVGVLAEFANNGILADQAGTGLRGVLSSLTSPSAIAADVMKKYGITLFDASGKFIGLAGAAGQLHDKLGGLTDQERSFALGQIFGNQQITTANILMKGGAEEVKKWTEAVNDQGFASQQARGKMDNLLGDIKKLGAAFESDLIKSGSTANGVLRGIVQSITGLASGFGNLPEPVQAVILGLGAVVAVVGLVGGGFLAAVPKIVAFKLALESVGTSLKTVGFAGGAVGIAIIGIVDVLARFGAAQAKAESEAQNLADTLDKQTGAITRGTRAFVLDTLEKDGTIKAAKLMGLTAKEVTDAYLQQPAAIKKVQTALKEMNLDQLLKNGGNGQDYIDAVDKMGVVIGRGAGAMKDGKEKAKDMANVLEEGAGSTDKASGSIDALAGAAENAKNATDDFNKALAGLGQVNLDASSAAIKYQQSIADMNASLKENGATLDLTTEAGRKNQSALDNIASSTIGVVASQQAAGASNDVLVAKMGEGRAAFVAAAIAAGKTAEQANALADEYHLVPGDVSTAFHTSGADAAVAAAAAVKAAYDAITKNLTIHLDTIFTQHGTPPGQLHANADGGMYAGGVKAFANGGLPSGIYSGGAPLYKFAEPETKWEAFISGKPGMESRNRQIWVDAGQRLGMLGGGNGAGSAGTPQFNVVVQSKGGVDLLKYVDVTIEQSNHDLATRLSTGYQRGTFG